MPFAKIEILDTTLREGLQTSGVNFTLPQKIRIVRLLDKFGVDFIEIGHPAVKTIFKHCQKISGLKLKAKTIVHSRAIEKDVIAGIESGADWVGIFMGVNAYSLKYKLGLNKNQAMKKIAKSVALAKKNRKKVRYSVEDSARTKTSDFLLAAKTAIKAGADRIGFVDTVGSFSPNQTYKKIKYLKKKISVPINYHCHDDIGLAVANSIIAYEAGAKLIDVTVNGIGERVGITPLEIITLALKRFYKVKNRWNFKIIRELTEVVSKFSGIDIPKQAPLVGEMAYTHKAGLHLNAVLKDGRSYEVIPPELIGRKRTILLGNFSGQKFVSYKIKELNLKTLNKKDFEKLMLLMRKSGNDNLTDRQFIELYRKLKKNK